MTEHIGDDVVALALGQVQGPRRAQLAAHLLTCPTCRDEYDDLAAAVDEVLPAVPAVQPPPGFEARTIGRMTNVPAGGDVAERRRPRPWRVAAAAAVAVLALATGAFVGSASGPGPAIQRPADAAQLIRAADQVAVGAVSRTRIQGEPMMLVGIVDAPPGVSYICRITLADGTVVEEGPFSPSAGEGAWLVALPEASPQVTQVDLTVQATGNLWSTAHFPR